MKTRIYPLLAAVVLGALAECGSPPDNRTEPASEIRSGDALERAAEPSQIEKGIASIRASDRLNSRNGRSLA